MEPRVIEYLKTPPSRAELVELIGRMGITVRDLLRQKGTPYDELGLADPALADDQLLDAMMAHPILINRPIVVTPGGVRLCRPSETVLDLLPARRADERGRRASSPAQGALAARHLRALPDPLGGALHRRRHRARAGAARRSSRRIGAARSPRSTCRSRCWSG